MRLFFAGTVRRCVGVAGLLFFALPVGLSVIGCGSKSTPVQYCTAGDSGPVVGQVAKIVLAPNFATVGESVNFGQIGASLSATSYDCKGNAVSSTGYTYATTSSYNVNLTGGPVFADINPRTGQVCGGTWNRNVGGGIPDYTTCTPPSGQTISSSIAANFTNPTTATASAGSTTTLTLTNGFVSGTLTVALGNGSPYTFTISPAIPLFQLAGEINSDSGFKALSITAVFDPTTLMLTLTGPAGTADTLVVAGSVLRDDAIAYLAYATATSNGAVSNPIAIYVHPVVTGIVLGTATPAANCPTATSPGIDPGTDCGLCSPPTTGTALSAPVYDGMSCLSQSSLKNTNLGQLVARVYSNGDSLPEHNITCRVGHVAFAAQTPNIATIDQNGVATANQPGSTVITATLSNSSTATQAGFLSTCPPASIELAVPGQPGVSSINVPVNTTQPLVATVLDTQGLQITGLALTYISTTPQTIPASVGTVTPTYPGSADITATCLPSSCNPSPFSQIGYLGNGKPITSNGITINAAGTSSTVLYMGSTQSQYVLAQDFTTNQPGTLIKLPYVPNSMVINLSGTGVFLGSDEGLMSFGTANNLLGATNQSVPGEVLSLSPDGSTLVVTDPSRNTISLVTSSGGVVSTYGGTATEAHWSPDAQTVYVTTKTGEVLTHSTFTDWQTTTPPPSENYTDVALTVPFVGAYFAGPTSTDGRSYCSTSTVSGAGNPPAVVNSFIPLADQKAVSTDRIAATTDGKHMIGAHAIPGSGVATLSDILLDLPIGSCPIPPQGGGTSTPVSFTSSTTTYPLTGVTAIANAAATPVQAPMAITGVYTSSNSLAAFATYTGSSNLLPFYAIPSSGAGTVQLLPLGNGASPNTNPVSGVFSVDNFSFYVGTFGPVTNGISADNNVHIFTLTYPSGAAATATETGIVSPNLPNANGPGYAPVNLLVQRPKKSTT